MIKFKIRLFYSDRKDLDADSKPDISGVFGVTLNDKLLTLWNKDGNKSFIIDGIGMGGTFQPNALVVWGFQQFNDFWKRVKIEMYHPPREGKSSITSRINAGACVET